MQIKNITELLKKYEIDENAKLSENSEYTLSLVLNEEDEILPKFMKEMQDYSFGSLKKLAIENIEELTSPNVYECSLFLKYCFPNTLKVFYMQSNMTEIKDLHYGLKTLLQSVTHQVYLM